MTWIGRDALGRVTDFTAASTTTDSDTPPNITVSGGAAEQTVLSRTTALTDAQIKALPTTAISVVPAPGAGLTIMPLKVSISADTEAGTYANLHASVSITFKLDTGELALARLSAAQVQELLTSFANNMAWMDGQTAGDVGYSMGVAASSNQPLMLRIDNVGAGNLTGGNAANTGSVTVVYTVIAL